MTAKEYRFWLLSVYRKDTKRRLLVVDSYRPHMTEESITIVDRQCNADVVIIPGGAPLSVNRWISASIKVVTREKWMRQDRPTTAAGNLKQPTRQDAINWVSQAWDSIGTETIVKSFLVCGISNSLDGTQDDIVSDDIPDADLEVEAEEDVDAEEDVGSDVDDMGEPFDSDPE